MSRACQIIENPTSSCALSQEDVKHEQNNKITRRHGDSSKVLKYLQIIAWRWMEIKCSRAHKFL